MSSKRYKNQGGSVISFVIVGVILAAGLIGAVYFLKQRGEQVRKEQAIAIYDQEKAAKEAAEIEAAKKEAAIKSEESKKYVDEVSTDQNQTIVVSTSELPATGIKVNLAELVGVFVLSVSAVGYVMSCRRLGYKSTTVIN